MVRFLICGIVVLLSCSWAAGAGIVTKDGLSLAFDDDGRITAVNLGGQALPAPGPGGFELTEVLPPKAQRRDAGLLKGKVISQGGKLTWTGEAGEGLALEASLVATDHIAVHGTVRDTTGKDRAVVVRFVVPVRAGEGWQYGASLYGIEKAGSNPSGSRRLRCEGDVRLPQMPFNSLSDPVGGAGVALGVPMDRPRVCFFRYDERGLTVEFDLGLAPDTSKFPQSADFHFVLYRVDGKWGFRSAARRFYDLFPGLFTRRARQFGSCAGLGEILGGEVADRGDFGITFGEGDFQWTNGQYRPAVAKAVKELHLDTFHWREPWSYFHITDKSSTPEQCLEQVKKQAAGEVTFKPHSQLCKAPGQEAARALLNSYMEDADGKPLLIRYQYGTWFFAPCMDPELPRPNRATIAADYQYFITQRWKEKDFDGPHNIAWDSATGWTGINRLNFRRAVWVQADVPLTFDGRTGRLCQLKGLADWEFAVWNSRQVHEAGGLVMANASIESILLFGHTMDVAIRESRAGGSPESLGLWRGNLYQKPMSFYGPATEAGIRQCLLLGLAPGGVVSKDSETYRPIAKKYMPAIQAQVKAGWQPVTHARAAGNALVERFGEKPGELYFAVMNTGRPGTATITVDAQALQFDPASVTVVELTGNRPVPAVAEGTNLTIPLDLDKDQAVSLHVKSNTRGGGAG